MVTMIGGRFDIVSSQLKDSWLASTRGEGTIAIAGPGVGTGRQAGFRFLCPRGVRVRLPPWAPSSSSNRS